MDAPSSYVHVGGERALIGSTIDAFFRTIVQRFPQHEAVVSIPEERRYTYAELDAAVERVARALVASGAGPGHRLGIWATNNTEWVLLQLATSRVGAVLVNVNPAYRSAELRHALRLARVETLVLMPSFRSSDYVRMVMELCPEAETCGPDQLRADALPDLRRLVIYDPGDPEGTPRPAPAFLTWGELLARSARVDGAAVRRAAGLLDMDDAINIQFTSGTTGFPKAVLLTHHNVLNDAFAQGELMGFTERDRLCVPVPFYHCFGMVLGNLLCLARGACIVIPADHFDAEATLRAIHRERCTAVHGVPTMFAAELDCPARADLDLSSLRTGVMAGAPCPPELVRRVMEDLGCREILVAYGQTEASPVTHSTRRHDSMVRRVETVGTNLPHQESKVVDPATGATLPVGAAGEICVRGYQVMKGYADDPEATRHAIDEGGWLHTGDLGAVDGEGYLRITGRLKDMIIRGGENVYPAEIEALYFGHPKVAQVAVFGVPDPRMGEEVGAWIRLHDGQHATVEEMRGFARERIAHYKVPRHVWFVDELPMTVTGKVQKFRIREIVAQRLRADLALSG